VAAIIGRRVNEQVEERRPVIAATFRAVQFVWEIACRSVCLGN
jgi:hypothetical protein